MIDEEQEFMKKQVLGLSSKLCFLANNMQIGNVESNTDRETIKLEHGSVLSGEETLTICIKYRTR